MTDYGAGVAVEPAIAMYGLRTFKIVAGRLASVVMSAGHWDGGVCIAKCQAEVKGEEPHDAPGDGCNCGIFATHSLGALFAQYGRQAHRITAVISAEGPTMVGTAGMRTAAARIVAYWVTEADETASLEADVCQRDCPNARRYYDVRVMARVYGLS